MTIVRGTLNPGGIGWDNSLRLVVGLAGADVAYPGDGELITAEQPVPLDDTGGFELDVEGNSAIVPVGTRWRFNIQPAAGYGRPRYVYVLVPATGGPYDIEDILSTEPGDILDPDTAALLSDRIGDLEALPVLPDPSAEPDNRRLHTQDGQWVTTDPAGASGVETVNGDPGPDVVIPSGAAAGTPSLRALGTTATTAAAGNDARLSDARTPTAHAASHQDGGSDELALDASQTTTGRFAAARLPAVLEATTASFLLADEAKLDHITVTQAVDLDAIETRVNALDAAVVLKGTWDASAGTFPGAGAAQAGESWIVSVGGTVNGVAFVANDRILAIVDNASTSTYAANWHKLDYTDQVLSVDGRTGALTLADLYDPAGAAAAAQAAAVQRANHTGSQAISTVTGLQAAIDAKGQKLNPTAVKTANYAAAANDLVPVDTTSGNVVVTFPTAPADGTLLAVKHVVRGGSNTVGLALGGSDVFNVAGGATTGTLTLANQAILCQYKASGAIWIVVADDLSLAQLDLRFQPIGAVADAINDGTTTVAPSQNAVFDALALKAPYSEIILDAQALGSVGGSPAVSIINNTWRAWVLDAATSESVATVISGRMLAGWTTFDVVAYMVNPSVLVAGDYVMRFDRRLAAASGGTLASATTTATPVTTAATTQNVLQEVTLVSGFAVPSTSELLAIRIVRVATDAADTLANDIGLVAIGLRRAS